MSLILLVFAFYLFPGDHSADLFKLFLFGGYAGPPSGEARDVATPVLLLEEPPPPRAVVVVSPSPPVYRELALLRTGSRGSFSILQNALLQKGRRR